MAITPVRIASPAFLATANRYLPTVGTTAETIRTQLRDPLIVIGEFEGTSLRRFDQGWRPVCRRAPAPGGAQDPVLKSSGEI